MLTAAELIENSHQGFEGIKAGLCLASMEAKSNAAPGIPGMFMVKRHRIALYFYRARFYDPQARRFISEDPIGLDGGINLYAYVGNNPINREDPMGLIENAKNTPINKCDKDPCNETYEKNKTYLDFMRKNIEEARVIAAHLNVPVEYILGVSGLESGWGGSRIAREDNNYFGLHNLDKGKTYPTQTGTDTAKGDTSVKIPIFPNPGYAKSGAAFEWAKGNLVKGAKDAMTFAIILHNHGYGSKKSYPGDLKSVIESFADRLKCLKTK
jgi:RHS repeat-associated protein